MTSAGLTLDRIRADVAAMLHEDPSQIGDDDNLIDLGLDSIRLMTLAQRWIDAGARIEFADLAERPAIRLWWELIASRLS